MAEINNSLALGIKNDPIDNAEGDWTSSPGYSMLDLAASLEPSARRMCELFGVNPNETIEAYKRDGSANLFAKWQVVAERLLAVHVERLSHDQRREFVGAAEFYILPPSVMASGTTRQ